jgi:cation diffusion facilitator family transporter
VTLAPSIRRLPANGVRMRAGMISLLVSLVLLGVKYFAYLMTGSTAVLSDALESIVNVVAAIFALVSLNFADKPADEDHPYGHGKIEFFSAAFEGGLIAFAALAIVYYAVVELVRGPELAQLELGVVLTAGAGIVNAVLGWYLVRTGQRTQSLTLIADGRHVLSDFWTSFGVVVGLGLVRATGIVWLDPAVAIVLGLNLARTGYSLVRHAAGGLLDEEDQSLLAAFVAAFDRTRFPGIIRMHRLRGIRAGRYVHVDAHLIVPEFWTVEQSHDAVERFEARVIDACPFDGEIVFHTDPCQRRLCEVCDLEGCAVRREGFERYPPLELAEARLTDESFWQLRERA